MQQFGGDWTENKLRIINKYLEAWTKVMKNQTFNTMYIDAFAGTGYRELHRDAESPDLILPELAEEEPQQFLDGSAKIALQVEPSFDKYVFIEKDPRKAEQLESLKAQFPEKSDAIQIIVGDANECLQKVSARSGWENWRAVLFLDPFGMEVSWETIEAIAATHVIDLWYLFPLGIGVNRMLKRDGKIPELWREKLTRLFGTTEWESVFFERETLQTLFGEEERIGKRGKFSHIAHFFTGRLQKVFPNGVANNPLALYNSRGNPLFLLCFAVSNPNPRAQQAALRIAQHILKMES